MPPPSHPVGHPQPLTLKEGRRQLWEDDGKTTGSWGLGAAYQDNIIEDK